MVSDCNNDLRLKVNDYLTDRVEEYEQTEQVKKRVTDIGAEIKAFEAGLTPEQKTKFNNILDLINNDDSDKMLFVGQSCYLEGAARAFLGLKIA